MPASGVANPWTAAIVAEPTGTVSSITPLGIDQLPPSLSLIERGHIEEVLRFTGGNKARAARILGITAATLYNKLKVYKAADAKTEPVKPAAASK